MSTLSDQELVILLRDDNKYAYTEIYQRYERLLYTHAYKRLQNRETSRDVVQDLFIILWSKRHIIKFDTSLRAYLYTAIRNRVFDLIAHQKIASDYVSSLQKFIDSGYYITDHRIRLKQLNDLIEKEITALPQKMREVFELSRTEQLSHKEIADRLNIAEHTVKKQVQNALKILKVKLGPLFTILFI